MNYLREALSVMLLVMNTAVFPGSASMNNFTNEESELLRYIRSAHRQSGPDSRPLFDSSQVLVVQFALTLVEILDFDDRKQTINVLVRKHHKWVDEFISWDPADYGGLETVRVATKSVWVPDVILINSVDKEEYDLHHKDYVIMGHDGTVSWTLPRVYRTSCPVDMLDYPYDKQTCNLSFIVWNHDSSQMELEYFDNYHEKLFWDYQPNAAWTIMDYTIHLDQILYELGHYYTMTYSLTILRKSDLHIRLMMVPMCLLSYMIPVIFLIPPTRPDRTTYGMSLFASFFLLVLITIRTIPPATSSKLGIYCLTNIVLVTVAGAITMVAVNFSTYCKRKPPRALTKLCCPILTYPLCVCHAAFGRSSHESTNETVAAEEGRQVQKLRAESEWKYILLVVDRLIFLLYTLCVLCLQLFYFPVPLIIKFGTFASQDMSENYESDYIT